MRIATWNLERPTERQPEKIAGLHERMLALNADVDIWILTETNSCVSPGSKYQSLATTRITGPERYAAGENRTTIWSRFPIIQSVKTRDPETSVCAEIEVAGKFMLIYGTIIPYHAAGTRYPYRFEGAEVAGRKGWELHYESIDHHGAEWRRLRKDFPTHTLCVAGDLNQNRDGRRWYGTKKGRQLLGVALAGANLACVTEQKIEPMEGDVLNPTIDHICIDSDLAPHATSLQGWSPGETPRGKRLSDHTGVAVTIPFQ